MDVIPVLIAVGCTALVVLIIVAIVISVRKEKERQQGLRAWAAHNGWAYTPQPAVPWASHLPGSQYRTGKVALLLSGYLNGRPVGVAEYSYTTQSTSTRSDGSHSTSTTTHRFIVMSVRLGSAYPPIAVVERGALSRLGRAMFGDSAAATGHGEFDRRFRVRTKDPALVRALLGPYLIGEHLAGRVPEWSLAGPDLLTWESGWIKDPNLIPATVAPLLRVADLLGR